MAPLSSTLQNDGISIAGFNYKELYKSKQGKYIDWFNVQCYNSFSEETFVSMIKNGYPSNKIVMGMEAGQFDEKTFYCIYPFSFLFNLDPRVWWRQDSG